MYILMCIHDYFSNMTTTKVQKWGNSLAVRLPQNIAKEADMEEGSALSLHTENRTVVLKPARKKPVLQGLIAKIKPRNIHKEVDWGKPQGKEIW